MTTHPGPRTDTRIDVAAVRARHPLVDVVAASGVALRPVGRGFMGCCPFHEDGTASLSVEGVADRFHCFGCGASGDVIDFTARLHGLGFREAVTHLEGHHTPDPATAAARRGRAVPHGGGLPSWPPPARAYQVHQWAWEHYTTPVAHATATGWLTRRRGIPLEALEARLGGPVAGSAGASWTGLVDHLRGLGVGDAELVALDLARATRRGTLVDALRSRVVLPVRDEEGRILGFLGRDTCGDPATPKYRNPARTVTYDKSRLLYRPDAGRPVPEGAVLVVTEGPLDALAVTAHAATGRDHQFIGVTACGTAVTARQATLALGLRHGPLVLAFDGDPAGGQATLRWVDLIARQFREPLHVAHLPEGSDPAAWLAAYPHAGFIDLDPTPSTWAPTPPGAELVRLVLADNPPGDPTPRILHTLHTYASAAGPDQVPGLARAAEDEMTRQRLNPDHAFTRALHHAGLPPTPASRARDATPGPPTAAVRDHHPLPSL